MDTPLRRSRNLALAASLVALPAAWPCVAQTGSGRESAGWRAQAARVEIVRDDWGIAHVTGKTDADAVFGAIYAQAEDDFARIEANYLTALGRTAEAEGEAAIWQDLRQRLFVDPASLKAQYAGSAPWLRRLMDAWAAGLNFYLATHPQVRPKVLTRFEPWMALSFNEGSIGGDIERISLPDVADFYGGVTIAAVPPSQEPRGSNGIAIAPGNTANGKALLLINPHTSFYFRSELQMTSGERLNAYGAATWGQFFIYQGFNARSGWMHTSSGVDSVDSFAETVIRGKAYFYGKVLRPLVSRPVTIAWVRADGTKATRTFTTWCTHHGPIVAARGAKWIAHAQMWKPVPALSQSWLRTKATDLASYLKVAGAQANSSNDTIFADNAGAIAYLHPQFVPVRDDRFDYRQTVEGADPATDWRGLTPLARLPQAVRPGSGWVMNTNNAPWGAAGADSPRQADFPRYMDTFGENPRGLHATMLLENRRDWTPETLMGAAFDRYLPAFASLLVKLGAEYDALPPDDPRRSTLARPIDILRRWDCRWSAESTATTLAVFWGDALRRDTGALVVRGGVVLTPARADQQLAALSSAVDRLTRDFGRWPVPWGEVNRFQRLDDAITPHFDDTAPSTPVPFVSALYGSLASFGASSYPGTRRLYGTSGNSFVAVVEFGARPRAWAVMAGGQSGTPGSAHFADQIDRYARGNLRRVYFEPADLVGHVERRYRPG
ncbi:penicillin acylase family protein [Sphingomonas sp.]|jgi:acyl-homoserine-lactone acylase|uniref:penicillin acylase family protein n=1 Tax=Sphingomonas sp. TaxID=28214 RepID=UPI002ED888C1